MRHKHADVLIAIAEGKEVEFSKGDKWQVWNVSYFSPIENSSLGWRIKPEPKPDVVRYFGMNGYTASNEIVFQNVYNEDRSFFGCWDNQIKVTFDGETGKLKSAEVINEN